MKRALDTAICNLFGIQYPIVQTGMGWVVRGAPHRRDERRRWARHPRVRDDDARSSSRRPSATSRRGRTRRSA